ncbi:fatty acyl-CoA reductase 1-like isoform X1 [Pseudomyrmex gracilis]|uniref:fatty acyl-CoA reductase 1-like isoform X1 n=1 Tax=Pseudomyrmex gracilis TaxID=219809 RepID=UPI0009958E42|nr:fatty acyl-CoA reductase 1-like isoform X1 [Pseudomyrmex gracilis]XP_020283245.1 fatty acyl-CoA reductase 1-like isoform X1 [Pseudomyrmex gracilis]
MSEDANTSILTFYSHRSVFITGGTGFLGKALCEKLLRSCPDIKEIFLLIRPKKGLTINDRLKKMLKNKLFDLLQRERPSSFEKIIPISGDVSIKDLGLLPEDRKMLSEKVSIIFHVAASVRFDESLKHAIFTNLRSTRDICILAQTMKNIVALLHVSSTYTQSDKPIVDEVLYPLEDVDWKKTIKIAETVDDEILKIFTAKYIGTMANTYVFTKRLAEQVINDFSESLPCIILRPSIVVPSVNDPVPGWSDNFNGPIGMLIGGGTGLLRVIYADSSITCDYIPVDLVIKAMIIVAWKRGIQNISVDNSLQIYNCSTHNMKSISIGKLLRVSFRVVCDVPLGRTIWKPDTILTNSGLLYYILVLVLHIVPALLVDGVLKILRLRPMLLKLQRRIYMSNRAVSYFVTHFWQFNNTNLINIFENLSAANEKDFGYKNSVNCDTEEYIRRGIIGAKLYLLIEDMSPLEQARVLRHRKRMDWLHEIIKILFVILLLYIFYSFFL